ncbi:hypothetical protein EB796_022014 [Bugula neritina]|uniref:Uncharacterized protein n=1 Tax=Bugula neritina TaxID=10212 RepID=A0A7J7J1U4_BUGNE|nr:hypothetical protein EB796_022014 [Bugula neritina]
MTTNCEALSTHCPTANYWLTNALLQSTVQLLFSTTQQSTITIYTLESRLIMHKMPKWKVVKSIMKSSSYMHDCHKCITELLR